MTNGKWDFRDLMHIEKSVSVVQVLDHYGLTNKLSQNRDTLTGRCPIHMGANSTDFRVSISRNCWNCFGACKRGGNVLDFVSLKEGVSVREAAFLIQTWSGIEAPNP